MRYFMPKFKTNARATLSVQHQFAVAPNI